ncbi:bacteriophage T4 gp5 trimerisation domain-containing protein, partial [Xenorhabdus szentirmaii]|nr:type VI secretion system tip protein VgrG [Xenorhabdus sp. CUL]
LPSQKTRTTFKTKTHKGKGFNELRFEDAKGSEEVFIHAQKDMNTKVLNDRDTHVLANHSETIEKNQNIEVYEHREETIGLTDTLDVGESLSITAGTVIELRCGSSVLRMDKLGNVTIQGNNFLFQASDAIQISAQDIDLN